MNLKMELIWLADKLDREGMSKEAEIIDYLLKKDSKDNWLDAEPEERTLMPPKGMAEEVAGLSGDSLGAKVDYGLDKLLRKEDILS